MRAGDVTAELGRVLLRAGRPAAAARKAVRARDDLIKSILKLWEARLSAIEEESRREMKHSRVVGGELDGRVSLRLEVPRTEWNCFSTRTNRQLG
jgi:hypothetical protein